MPIVVPPPSGPPMDVSGEIAIQRALTKAFIDSAPVSLELTPYVRQKKPSGGFSWVEGEPRPMQVFRLIPMSHTERPVPSTSTAGSTDSGVQRKYEYTLLGTWDSEMQEYDRFETPEGQLLVIDALVSYNGYERKGLVNSYGRRPEHG